MPIEQIIEFELSEPGPPGRICTPTTDYFRDQTKISQRISANGLFYYLLLRYCRRQCNLLLPIWAKSLTKFNPKMPDFKRVLDLNCK